jgi:hypothetical protein
VVHVVHVVHAEASLQRPPCCAPAACWRQLVPVEVELWALTQCLACCRDTATVLLAVGGASLSVMSLHCHCHSGCIEAVSIMASFGKQFVTQHYLGRETVDVPADFVEALLQGASALLQQLRSGNQQAQLRSEADHSSG